MAEQSEQADRKKQFLEALLVTDSNISEACERTGVGRTTYYDWKRDDPDFAESAKHAIEHIKDWVEDKILAHIKEGNVTAAIFYAKTKMKDRGYIEKSEFDHNIGSSGGGIMFYIPDNGRDKKQEEKSGTPDNSDGSTNSDSET